MAVLYSGGIDSAVLAFLADRYAVRPTLHLRDFSRCKKRFIPVDEPIDLLNVAFENPRKQAKDQNPNRKKKGRSAIEDRTDRREAVTLDHSTSYLVPDRGTGLEGLAELQRLCPHRIWNFVCSDSRTLLLSRTNGTFAHQVEVDVPFEESQSAQPLVEELMFPCRTIMDLVRTSTTILTQNQVVPHTHGSRGLEFGDRTLLCL